MGGTHQRDANIAMQRYLSSSDPIDSLAWDSGLLQRNQMKHLATNMSKPVIAAIVQQKAALGDEMRELSQQISGPVVVEKTGTTGGSVILDSFTVVTLEPLPMGATPDDIKQAQGNLRRALYLQIAAIGSERDALECLVSCMICLYPEAWKSDVLETALGMANWSLAESHPIYCPEDVEFPAEKVYKELVAFTTLGLLMMGKNVGGEAVNIGTFLQLRIKAITNTLNLDSESEGYWESQETAKFIANGTDGKKSIRTYLFNYLLKIRSANVQETLEKGTRMAMEYLKNAFITTLAAVMTQILEPGHSIYIIKEVIPELRAVSAYLRSAAALSQPHWTYVRLAVSESDLRPLPATAFPVLATVALGLASLNSSTISRVPTPSLTRTQQCMVSKIMALIQTAVRHESQKEGESGAALKGGSKELMDLAGEDLANFVPYQTSYVGSDRPTGIPAQIAASREISHAQLMGMIDTDHSNTNQPPAPVLTRTVGI